MILLADIGTTLTGVGTLGTVIAVITGVVLNVRKRPSDELLAQAAARSAEDAFYKGRLETSEKELAEETVLRRAAEERAAMRDRDVAALRRAKDDQDHEHRLARRELRERVARLEEQVRALGATPAP